MSSTATFSSVSFSLFSPESVRPLRSTLVQTSLGIHMMGIPFIMKGTAEFRALKGTRYEDGGGGFSCVR